MRRPAGGATSPLWPAESLLNEQKSRLIRMKKKIKRESHMHPHRGIAVVARVKDNPGRDGLRLVRWRSLPPGTGILSHQLLLGLRSSSFLRHNRR